MDANEKRSRMLAAKSVAEQARVKHQMERAGAIFAEATNIDQVLSYLAGGASVAWNKRPTGEFDTELATALVSQAHRRIIELMFEAAKANLKTSELPDSTPTDEVEVPFEDALVNMGFSEDEELAERIEREGDHA